MRKTYLIIFSVLFGLLITAICGWAVKKYLLPDSLTKVSLEIGRQYSVERDINYCSPGGEPQGLDLYKLSGKGTIKYPVVVYMHGGGWSEGDKSSGEVLEYLPLLTKAGYSVASINYRLLPEHKFPRAVEDAKCAVRFLRANAGSYDIDADNIAVIGESAGGYLAALLGATGDNPTFKTDEYKNQSDRVQAVVDIFGPSDFTASQADSSRISTALQFLGSTSPAQASPITYISYDDAPFLIIHGDQDKTVPLNQSRILHDGLQRAGVGSELIVIKNAGHNLPRGGDDLVPTPYEIANIILSFLNKNLK